jgi:signal transduction histidine kinase
MSDALPYAPRVLLTDRAGQRTLPGLAYALPRDMELREASLAVANERPAVLVLTPEDLLAPDTTELERIATLCRPGRPILLGGTSDRDALMAAINVWRVAQVLPADASHARIAAALSTASAAVARDLSLPRRTAELVVETGRQEKLLADLRATRAHLFHAERLTTMGRITGGLIVAMRQHLRQLGEFEATIAQHELDDPEVGPLVRAAFDGISGITGLVDEVNAYAEERGGCVHIDAFDLDALVERVVAFSRFDRLGREREVVIDTASSARVLADRRRLSQALLNLLRNAFQATEPFGRITVSTARLGEAAVIEITDSGTGIAADVISRIFEPFFTTKDEGMGLGLHVTRMSIERQGGRIECESPPGAGATFRVTLPLV